MFIIKYLKSILYVLIGLLITTLLITVMNYFNIFGSSTIKWFILLFVILSLFVGGFYIGKGSTSKGYLEGLKLGIIIIFLLFLISYLGFYEPIKFKNLLYYLLLLTSSVLGSITGINKKLRNKS